MEEVVINVDDWLVCVDTWFVMTHGLGCIDTWAMLTHDLCPHLGCVDDIWFVLTLGMC